MTGSGNGSTSAQAPLTRRFATLAFIENDMYARNFLRSGAFDALLAEGSLGICVSDQVVRFRDEIPTENLAGEYRRVRENIDLIYQFNQVSMRALRKRSATLRIKADAAHNSASGKGMYIFGPLSIPPVDRLAERVIGKRFARNMELAYLAAATPVAYPTFVRRMRSRFSRNASIERLIDTHNPEVVLVPATGVEATPSEMVILSRARKFVTFVLMNGWDNLSSKGVFPFLPDYLGVWGPQSVAHAHTIQGMPPERTVLLGCARYEDYYKSPREPAAIFPHKYVLFAGATTACDEITPLRLLDEALETIGRRDIKIVYRPHPWREKRRCFDVFRAEEYRNVILDPQVAESYYAEKAQGTESSSSQNFPGLQYYPQLLNNALFVVSPMSSMMLEAAIFDVPTLALAHDDGYHPIPPSHQAQYEHFTGASDIPGWFFVRRLDDLKQQFHQLVERFGDDTPVRRSMRPVLSAAIQRYLHDDRRSYSTRLHEAVTVIRASRAKALETPSEREREAAHPSRT